MRVGAGCDGFNTQGSMNRRQQATALANHTPKPPTALRPSPSKPLEPPRCPVLSSLSPAAISTSATASAAIATTSISGAMNSAASAASSRSSRSARSVALLSKNCGAVLTKETKDRPAIPTSRRLRWRLHTDARYRRSTRGWVRQSPMARGPCSKWSMGGGASAVCAHSGVKCPERQRCAHVDSGVKAGWRQRPHTHTCWQRAWSPAMVCYAAATTPRMKSRRSRRPLRSNVRGVAPAVACAFTKPSNCVVEHVTKRRDL